ncbi:unannotated protein [freshwater metagenome]|uniref:Unannotated protein n=1 Tax=freshwater metagenome TaxID=449393 RepID=A0A6J6HE24_9ZZZZ
MRNTQLPFDVASLAFFIDEEANDCGAVLSRQLHDAVETTSFGFTIFEIGGIKNCAPAEPRKSCFHNLGFGGVENERNTGLRSKQFREFVHVVRAVTADVVDADIENVSAFAYLVFRHLHTGVEIGIE